MLDLMLDLAFVSRRPTEGRHNAGTNARSLA